MTASSVFDCSVITLPQNHQLNGNLTSVSNSIEVPFDIKRVYYLYDVPGGFSRGGHGHKELQQLIVALSGSFDLIVDDGNVKRTFHLSRPNIGVYMPAGLWRELDNFSSGSICFVLASTEYDEQDYFRDYENFVEWKSLK
jgi:dTDP-4-dehydrorhamnose 3,5-epimerase-like enzyme